MTRHRHVLDKVQDMLEHITDVHGNVYTVSWRCLDSSEYGGVPCKRNRVYIVAVKGADRNNAMSSAGLVCGSVGVASKGLRCFGVDFRAVRPPPSNAILPLSLDFSARFRISANKNAEGARPQPWRLRVLVLFGRFGFRFRRIGNARAVCGFVVVAAVPSGMRGCRQLCCLITSRWRCDPGDTEAICWPEPVEPASLPEIMDPGATVLQDYSNYPFPKTITARTNLMFAVMRACEAAARYNVPPTSMPVVVGTLRLGWIADLAILCSVVLAATGACRCSDIVIAATGALISHFDMSRQFRCPIQPLRWTQGRPRPRSCSARARASPSRAAVCALVAPNPRD